MDGIKMNIDLFLSRLQKVKKNGRDYIACCPSHQDKSPSMTIAEREDGRILVHCFAGCSAQEIVESVGMTLSDLMPDTPLYHRKQPDRVKFNPFDVLAAVRDDLTVSLVLCKDMQNGRILDAKESLLLAKLIGRVSMAIQLAGGRE
jgi:hypothetical protein